jgi:hypothetical protein
MSVREILRGQRLALRRLFAGPLVAVLVADVLLLGVGLHDPQTAAEDEHLLVAAFIAGMVMLIADYHALVWTGLWLGLAAKNIRTASSGAVSRILLLPWLVFILSLQLFVTHRPMSGSPGPGPLAAIIWWFVIGLGIDWIFGSWAYRKLHREFRAVAMRRFQMLPSRSSWWWLGRGR